MSGSIMGMAQCYNLNSCPQQSAIELSVPFIRKGIEILNLSSSTNQLIIADFGSAQGFNSIYAMKMIIQYLKEIKGEERSVLVIHNDLPSNGWEELFNLVNNNEKYYGLASGKSFYEQCIPSNSLSIAYSSTAIHWLSHKPCNLKNHCSILFSHNDEFVSFKCQARYDYSQFLKYRSLELIHGGVLILSILCLDKNGLCGTDAAKRLLYECAQSVPFSAQELINYTITEYIRTYDECVDHSLFNEHGLELVTAEIRAVESKIFSEWQRREVNIDEFAKAHTQYMRGWSESAVRQALEECGERKNEEIPDLVNQFWMIYEQEVKKQPDDYDSRTFRTFLVLRKL